MFNFRHCEGAPQAPLKSAELLTEHKVCCMENALCEWSLRLETLWGRTFLPAIIFIRMISHSDDVFLFSPRCIAKEISTRCILQQKQQRNRKSMQHWRVLSCLLFKPCPCKVPWNLKVQGALKSCLTSSLASLCDRHAAAKYGLPGHEMLFYSMSDLTWEAGKCFGWWAFDCVNITCHVTAKWPLLLPSLGMLC